MENNIFDHFEFKIREVNNGHIVTYNESEYIFDSTAELAEWIEKTIRKPKRNRAVIE